MSCMMDHMLLRGWSVGWAVRGRSSGQRSEGVESSESVVVVCVLLRWLRAVAVMVHDLRLVSVLRSPDCDSRLVCICLCEREDLTRRYRMWQLSVILVQNGTRHD